MAGTFHRRPSHPDAPNQTYDSIASQPSPTYPDFPPALQHDTSGYDASGYEPGEHRHQHSEATQHADHSGMDLQASPIEQNGFVDDHISHGLQHTHFSPPGDIDDDEAADLFRMLPPAASTHASWQALYDYAQTHAAAEGYALSINTTAKNRSRIKLACVCYGQPKNTHKLTAETRIRKNRVSYKTGCKMWVEGKKLEDGAWLLRVGESQHNHPGRPSEGWAAQRKRTWGVVGGRIGVGGVTAQEELARMGSGNKTPLENGQANGEDNEDEANDDALGQYTHKSTHLQRGGLVWKIVEQEMLRKREQLGSRDGSVDRTVEVLHARLPGIHIFKRDVYNIRAAIKRAWKAAEEQGGESDDQAADTETKDKSTAHEEGTDIDNEAKSRILSHPEYHQHTLPSNTQIRDFALDPSLAQPAPPSNSLSTIQILSASTVEVEQLRKEVAQLKTLLAGKTKELMEKDIMITSLRSQLEYFTSMAM
ncbi:hypothetical protein CC86DRAFT_368598, partial [Ophiobolus disseminans]